MVNRPSLYEILSYARRNRTTSYRGIARGLRTSQEWVARNLQEYQQDNTKNLVRNYTKDKTGKWCETYAQTFKNWVVPIDVNLMEIALKNCWTFGLNLK